jgi:hypothetical protein
MSYLADSGLPSGGQESRCRTSSRVRGRPSKGPVAWVKETRNFPSGINQQSTQQVYPGVWGEWYTVFFTRSVTPILHSFSYA